MASSAFGDDDLQITSLSKQFQKRAEMPSLIPIQQNIGTSFALNGHHSMDISNRSSSSAIGLKPTRGRRSVFDMEKRSTAFNNTPPPLIRTSVITQQNNLEVKDKYDKLLKKLVGKANNNRQVHTINRMNDPSLITIDLSAEENTENRRNLPNSKYVFRSTKARPDDKTRDIVDLSDDDDDDDDHGISHHFSHQNKFLSSTFLRSPTDKLLNFGGARKNEIFQAEIDVPKVTPINTLKEKQAQNKACDPDAIDKITKRFQESREEKDRSISEEKLK